MTIRCRSNSHCAAPTGASLAGPGAPSGTGTFFFWKTEQRKPMNDIKELIVFMRESGVKSLHIEMQESHACACLTETVAVPPVAEPPAEIPPPPPPPPAEAPKAEKKPEPKADTVKNPAGKPKPKAEAAPAKVDAEPRPAYDLFVELVERDDGGSETKTSLAETLRRMTRDDLLRVNNSFRLGVDTDVGEIGELRKSVGGWFEIEL